MKIKRNLRGYLYTKSKCFGYDRNYYIKSNNKYTRKNFLKQVCDTYEFKLYSLRCEMKFLLTVVQQTLSDFVSRVYFTKTRGGSQ